MHGDRKDRKVILAHKARQAHKVQLAVAERCATTECGNRKSYGANNTSGEMMGFGRSRRAY